MNCLACSENINSEPLDSYKSYKLYNCHACDLIFWHPMKSPGAEWYEESYGAPIIPKCYRLKWVGEWGQKQFLKDKLVMGSQLLEIGCGQGDLLFQAQQIGYSVTGIDLTNAFIESARQRFGFERIYALTLHDFIGENLANKYDVIAFFGVLEHLDSLSDFLPLVKALLRPGGSIVCVVPNRAKWRFWLVKEEYDYPPNHFTRWNPNALRNYFSSQGFSILKIKKQPIISHDHEWVHLVSSKLGIEKLVGVIAQKLSVKSVDQTRETSHSLSGTTSGMLIKLGLRLYVRFLTPLIELLTLPLKILMRRHGTSIYLLATMKEAE